MADVMQKHELWLKLMMMTTSPNDGEALIALRKATELMNREGFTWERLLRGKITVIADPFGSAPVPHTEPKRAPPPPPPPRPRNFYDDDGYAHPTLQDCMRANDRIAQRRRDDLARQQAATARAQRSLRQLSTRTNLYPGGCWACGCDVEAHNGWLVRIHDYHPTAVKEFGVFCDNCNSTVRSVQRTPAKRTYKPMNTGVTPGLGSL